MINEGIYANIFIFKLSLLARIILHRKKNNHSNMFNGKYIFKGIRQEFDFVIKFKLIINKNCDRALHITRNGENLD